jgi:hypothetical protein
MWNWFKCYLSGRHEYGVACGHGAIFLRCVHCGRRSPGWSLEAKPTTAVARAPQARPRLVSVTLAQLNPSASPARVLPFQARC